MQHTAPAQLILPFCTQQRVEFADTDMAGIAHFCTAFRFMETAEAAFFRALGWSLISQDGDWFYGFPRVAVDARFHRPMKFQDLVEIRLSLAEVLPERIHYTFVLNRLLSDGSAEKAASGKMVTAFARRHISADQLESCRLPTLWQQRLQELASAIQLS